MQHIEQHHQVAGRGDLGHRGAGIGLADFRRPRARLGQRGAGAVGVGRRQFDTQIGARHRRRRPARRPAVGMALLRRQQPAGQQALAAADIENAGAVGDQPLRQRDREDRIVAQLEAGEMHGKGIGRPVARAGPRDQRLASLAGGIGPARHAGTASRSVT
ncbi:hypothetical protein GCM10009078_32850 [Cupriavidus gilardii]